VTSVSIGPDRQLKNRDVIWCTVVGPGDSLISEHLPGSVASVAATLAAVATRLFWQTTEVTLGLPPIIKGLKPYQGRLVRRLVVLFSLSALVPLGLCAALLFRGFNDELSQAQAQRLDGALRSFGATLLGRIGSADDALKLGIAESGRNSEAARSHVAKLAWVSSVHRTDRSDLSKRAGSLPKPDASQERALRTGGALLLTDKSTNGRPAMYLVRAVAGGTWLYAQIDPAWLWAGAAGLSGEAALILLDAHGQVLSSTGKVPSELPSSWISRSWELSLAGHYASPSLRLVAVGQRSTLLHLSSNSSLYFGLFASIALAVVLIVWLSLVSIRKQLRPLELLTQAAQHLAQHDFEAFRGMSWNDELGELARSFDTMSQKLRRQFSALETFAEVDRLLLSNSPLNSVLSALLPGAVEVLGCDAVSVVLFGTQPARDARAYAFEHYAGQPAQRDPRIIVSGIAGLRTACNCPAVQVVRSRQLPYFSPNAPHPIGTIRTFPLKNKGAGIGLLCLGHIGEVLDRPDSGVSAEDFAERLSRVLADLRRTKNGSRRVNVESMQAAGSAMSDAKDVVDGQEKLSERVRLESEARQACQAGAFTLHYQPILGGAEAHGVGVEALIRLPSTGELARISPAELISLAEGTGLIVELGDWVLNTACRQFAQWQHEGLELEYIAVNVSVRQLEDPEFLTRLHRALAVDGMRGEHLQLEMTESVLAHDAALRPVLEDIVALGVRLALDDSGTGTSALGCLRTYPIRTLKIDRSLVLGLPQDGAACKLVESIISTCDGLERHVVAEGVETEAQRDFLLALGCAGLQGFLLGRPLEAAAVPHWLSQLPSGLESAAALRKQPWMPTPSAGHGML